MENTNNDLQASPVVQMRWVGWRMFLDSCRSSDIIILKSYRPCQTFSPCTLNIRPLLRCLRYEATQCSPLAVPGAGSTACTFPSSLLPSVKAKRGAKINGTRSCAHSVQPGSKTAARIIALCWKIEEQGLGMLRFEPKRRNWQRMNYLRHCGISLTATRCLVVADACENRRISLVRKLFDG